MGFSKDSLIPTAGACPGAHHASPKHPLPLGALYPTQAMTDTLFHLIPDVMVKLCLSVAHSTLNARTRPSQVMNRGACTSAGPSTQQVSSTASS